VYIAGRDEGKATKTIAQLKAETGKEALFLKLDLGSLKSVKAAAAELASKEQAVHMLFNNACVLFIAGCDLHTYPYPRLLEALCSRPWIFSLPTVSISSGVRTSSGNLSFASSQPNILYLLADTSTLLSNSYRCSVPAQHLRATAKLA
jgi:hypothetical protein